MSPVWRRQASSTSSRSYEMRSPPAPLDLQLPTRRYASARSPMPNLAARCSPIAMPSLTARWRRGGRLRPAVRTRLSLAISRTLRAFASPCTSARSLYTAYVSTHAPSTSSSQGPTIHTASTSCAWNAWRRGRSPRAGSAATSCGWDTSMARRNGCRAMCWSASAILRSRSRSAARSRPTQCRSAQSSPQSGAC